MHTSAPALRDPRPQAPRTNTALLFDSARYAASSHAAGSVLIHLQTDPCHASSTLLQGEDATRFADTLETLSALPTDRAEPLFDALCAEYHVQH